ncbi:hypothetical protein, partial [Enterovibrio norvegicus]|uniref:hypothetical protein n=1 Tax=Enterovibrio norvegicus TaxID=188144 RepID=UPI0010423176
MAVLQQEVQSLSANIAEQFEEIQERREEYIARANQLEVANGDVNTRSELLDIQANELAKHNASINQKQEELERYQDAKNSILGEISSFQAIEVESSNTINSILTNQEIILSQHKSDREKLQSELRGINHVLLPDANRNIEISRGAYFGIMAGANLREIPASANEILSLDKEAFRIKNTYFHGPSAQELASAYLRIVYGHSKSYVSSYSQKLKNELVAHNPDFYSDRNNGSFLSGDEWNEIISGYRHPTSFHSPVHKLESMKKSLDTIVSATSNGSFYTEGEFKLLRLDYSKGYSHGPNNAFWGTKGLYQVYLAAEARITNNARSVAQEGIDLASRIITAFNDLKEGLDNRFYLLSRKNRLEILLIPDVDKMIEESSSLSTSAQENISIANENINTAQDNIRAANQALVTLDSHITDAEAALSIARGERQEA